MRKHARKIYENIRLSTLEHITSVKTYKKQLHFDTLYYLLSVLGRIQLRYWTKLHDTDLRADFQCDQRAADMIWSFFSVQSFKYNIYLRSENLQHSIKMCTLCKRKVNKHSVIGSNSVKQFNFQTSPSTKDSDAHDIQT